MTYQLVTIFITIIAFIALFVTFLFKGPKGTATRIYSFHIFSVIVWSFGQAMVYYTQNLSITLFWVDVLYVGGSLIAASFLHFSFYYPENYRRLTRLQVVLIYLPSVILAYLFFFTPFIVESVISLNGLKVYTYGKGHALWDLQFVSFFMWAFYRFLRSYRRNSGVVKHRLRYIIVGTLIALVWSGTTNVALMWVGVFQFTWSGPVFSLTWLLCVSYAIVRYRLLDIKIVVTRGGIFLVVYTIVLGFPFWFASKTGLWIWALVLMGVLASIGPFIYYMLQKKAEGLLLAEQRHYQKILLQASEGMIREHNLNKLLKLIVYILKRSVKIKFAAIFLLDKEENAYKLKSIRDYKSRHPNVIIPVDHPFIEFMNSHKEPFTFEEFSQSANASLDIGLEANLIVPSFMQSGLLGFLILGEKLNKTLYSEADISVFKTLSNQAALAVENCIFMEESRKAQERLFNAEKLASIGGMADGVAHQIKNRLNAFSVVAGEQGFEIADIFIKHAALLEQNPELKASINYLKEGTDSIASNVKKTNGIIQGILNYAKTEQKETYFAEFGLEDIVVQCAELVKIKHQSTDLPLVSEIKPEDTIFGVKAQIMECIYNSIDNSYEAIREKIDYQLKPEESKQFKPEIRLRLIHDDKTSTIEISDNGIGIKPDDKLKVFTAFFTTKPSSKSGSGIGTYVVKRMIEEYHKGKIWFKSEYMNGTTFYIELPRKRRDVPAS